MHDSINKSKIVYLPGLNGIRAIAAFLVLCWHIYQYLELWGIKTNLDNSISGFGVTLFFVLSGYLITYLLLIEKERYGTIKIKNFYIRRILRIWPIYYLAILGSFIMVISGLNYFEYKTILPNYLYYIFMLANIPFTFGTSLYCITPLWSIGVEEQFYAFWPMLFKHSKKIIYSVIFVIVFFFLH